MSIFSFLERQDGTAVIHPDGTLTYPELNRLLATRVARLDDLDLELGSRVAIVLPNSLELLLSYYACLLAGLVAVPINERLAPREVGGILDHSRPGCVITTSAQAERYETVLYSPEWVTIVLGEAPRSSSARAPSSTDAEPSPATEPYVAVDRSWPPEHPAILFYTSGSTGAPKGVLYTHRTLIDNARVYGDGLGITAHDHSVLPHCMASNFVFAQLTVPFLARGARVEIVDFGDVDATLAAIDRGATFLSLIPWFGFQMIEAARARPRHPNRLRIAEVGGDRVPRSFFTEFEEAFGIVPCEHLGMAETNVYVVNPLVAGDLRIGSVGTPLPEVRIEVRDRDRRALPTGSEGEIWVETPAAMEGYWEDPTTTAATLVDGWVATGDAGYLDEDGYLWYTGRIKQIIICDGDNIHPAEVEHEIARHPLVRQVCVVGLPHPTRGETVAAAVIPERPDVPVDLGGLEEFLADRLTDVKIPSRWLVLEEFPETAQEKIDRRAIISALLEPPDAELS